MSSGTYYIVELTYLLSNLFIVVVVFDREILVLILLLSSSKFVCF